ncbi:hypothetical protein GCM10027037_28540 [Mucilaginibacter koreensis]
MNPSSFNLNIGTRKITATPDANVQVKNGELTGTFVLTENDKAAGTISFDQKSWENKNTGDLSYVELEAIAEELMMQYV